ncbi:molybdopterin cofactor-binding domain-containing protein [Variovorax sp. PCZ-1]|uniref:xanthine dehydrogenase family protein molybdopterin-binding subunit n=1 Tax=Variovorax sp. PCZ-1 TaxID=2835533 RepID=UPI001BCF5BBF|nr:molybdopterin cofactor-binding domain-containing protein [Variovorax sp. PCZ-1]MBS7807237.1 xanthine dehydrogenase family protein molybdopterin-binding subunit [Variovorax sp. PCZ-1]
MQESYFQLSRRAFLGAAGAGGVSALYHELADAKPGTSPVATSLPQPDHPHLHAKAAPGWSGAPGKARYRIEGMRKVTGQKIYARDFRAKDMQGWPAQERVAMILRADNARLLFMGINLEVLSADLQPITIIQQADLLALNLSLPFSNTPALPEAKPQLLVTKGTAAQFYGQPVAILIFKDWQQYRAAKRVLQFNKGVVQYGSITPEPRFTTPYSPVNYLTRYEAPGIAPFSQVQVGYESNPNEPNSTKQPYNETAKRLRGAIDAALSNPAHRSFSGTYHTQVLDPMFMEPEAGLAWLDPAAGGTLNLVLGTQATNGDVSDITTMFTNSCKPSSVALKQVALYSCYPGGGFGGRDVSTFPALLAVTAALAGNVPVRIAQDRYEQFQSGLKQLASRITHSLAVDKDGKFTAFKSNQILPSGGNNNYSQFVAMLAAYCGLSGYNIDKASVDAIAKPSLGVVAGSMRGFGGPQASFAVETLVDEAAVALGRDPIELREKNVLKQGDRTITGAPLTQPMTLAEICRRAKAHPLWVNRAKTKLEKAKLGIAYGVGFALANQAYGTGTDGVMAEVSISSSGELKVRTNCVDMGNGSATTLAISTAGFAGQNAEHVVMGDQGYFNALQMITGNGIVCGVDPKDPATFSWANPAWTASFSMSSSACLTAFHQVHVTEQAARVLFEAALLPAAAAIWNVPLAQVQGKAVWRDAKLNASGLPPLALPDIAARLYAMKLPKGAMVHGLYQGTWVSASYAINGGKMLLPIDGLALQASASQSWQVITRQDLIPPDPKAALYGRSLFAPSGVLVAVELDPKNGQPKVTDVELMVDAGKVLQRDLLMGQAEGGIAMGIGYALLEDLPLEAGGAGDGKWNLDRYHVALASDMPTRMNITTLPTTEPTAKGIAEAVLCPIAPAIGNAIAHATGKRVRSLPITAAKIKGA